MKKSLLILSLFALLGTGCNKTSSSTNEVSSSKTPISNNVSSSSKEESSTHVESSSSIEQSSSSSESSKTPDVEFYNVKGTIKNVFKIFVFICIFFDVLNIFIFQKILGWK